jgi:hypothetical protein
MTKSAQLRMALEQAKSDHDRATKAVRAAESDLFFAREALDKADREYIEYLKNKPNSAQVEGAE